MADTTEYKVDLEIFEGPLDLLLYLIKKEEVDIYNIPIERITTQYMEFIRVMRMLDLNIAGEFIVMAATLMLIKSRMLLPEEERIEEEEEEGEDPRWELVKQLVEYKKFKDAALRLQQKELEQEDIFGIGLQLIGLDEDAGVAIQDVGLFDLITAFNEVLKRTASDRIGEILGDRFTVADKIDVILGIVRAGRPVSFSSLFPSTASRNEVICTFLALLELIRLRQIEASQSRVFGEIQISAVVETVEVADVTE